MITDALLWAVGSVVGAIGSLFPVADLSAWPSSGTSIGTWIGEQAGPVNGVMPVAEMVQFINFVILIWLPAVLIYQGIMWAYKHLPIVGAG